MKNKANRNRTIVLVLIVWVSINQTIEAQMLDVNRIKMPISNNGMLGRNLSSEEYYGASWEGWERSPVFYNNNVVFEQGLWVTGKKNGNVGCIPGMWNSAYTPGQIINGQPGIISNPQDSNLYRVYILTAGNSPDQNPDFTNWPVDLGAPIDKFGNPLILGNQTTWTVYNGADTSTNLIPYFNWHDLPARALLPIEIHQTAFEHFGDVGDTAIWANSVFFEWEIYNKGPDQLDSVYFTLWSDIDFLDYYSTIPAVDTTCQTGYCWYSLDSSYGSVAYTLLYGPSIVSPGDTSIFFGHLKPGYKNLPLSSFRGMNDDSRASNTLVNIPYSIRSAWNLVRGLSLEGNVIIDSSSFEQTTFPFSGDPITHTGYLFPYRITGGGAGIMMTIGPVTIAPSDSQWIMMVMFPSIKLNGIDALTRMRTNAKYLRSLPYDSLVLIKPSRNVPANPLPPSVIPDKFTLYPNYPNPFNSGTVISFDLPEESIVGVDIFDVLGRKVAFIPDQRLQTGLQKMRWFPGCSSGIYFIRIHAHSIESSLQWSGINKVAFIH